MTCGCRPDLQAQAKWEIVPPWEAGGERGGYGVMATAPDPKGDAKVLGATVDPFQRSPVCVSSKLCVNDSVEVYVSTGDCVADRPWHPAGGAASADHIC